VATKHTVDSAEKTDKFQGRKGSQSSQGKQTFSSRRSETLQLSVKGKSLRKLLQSCKVEDNLAKLEELLKVAKSASKWENFRRSFVCVELNVQLVKKLLNFCHLMRRMIRDQKKQISVITF